MCWVEVRGILNTKMYTIIQVKLGCLFGIYGADGKRQEKTKDLAFEFTRATCI